MDQQADFRTAQNNALNGLGEHFINNFQMLFRDASSILPMQSSWKIMEFTVSMSSASGITTLIPFSASFPL